MHFLVTGGLGFVGSRFVELARSELKNSKFTIFDNFSQGKFGNLAFLNLPNDLTVSKGESIALTNDITVFRGDVENKSDLNRIDGDIHSIIHLAGNTGVQPSIDDPWLDLRSNIIGTMNVLEFARSQSKIPQVIFSSSNAPLGEAEQPVSEKSPCSPLSPYGASKLAAEGYMSAYNASFGVPTITLRFGNLYGIGSDDKSSVVAKFIKHALKNESWPIYGDGSQSRDFLYLDDLIEAIIKSAQLEGSYGEIFQISTGQETTIKDLCEKLTLALKQHSFTAPEIKYTPKRSGDMPKNYSDVTKAKNVLGWQAKTPLIEGLNYTLDWFLS